MSLWQRYQAWQLRKQYERWQNDIIDATTAMRYAKADKRKRQKDLLEMRDYIEALIYSLDKTE